MFDLTITGPKPMDFLIRFLGYVVPSKRIGTELPETIFMDKLVRVLTKEQLEHHVNESAAVIIIKQRGMIVFKDQNPETIQKGDDDSFIGRIFVPMEMLSYVECTVTRIVGETPNHVDGQNVIGEGVEQKELKAN